MERIEEERLVRKSYNYAFTEYNIAFSVNLGWQWATKGGFVFGFNGGAGIGHGIKNTGEHEYESEMVLNRWAVPGEPGNFEYSRNMKAGYASLSGRSPTYFLLRGNIHIGYSF